MMQSHTNRVEIFIGRTQIIHIQKDFGALKTTEKRIFKLFDYEMTMSGRFPTKDPFQQTSLGTTHHASPSSIVSIAETHDIPREMCLNRPEDDVVGIVMYTTMPLRRTRRRFRRNGVTDARKHRQLNENGVR
jgi:hypothetical protein